MFRAFIICLLAVCLGWTVRAKESEFQFKHPGFALSAEGLAYVKQHQTEEPYASALAELKGATPLGYRMRGPFEEVSRTPNRHLGEWCGDMQMIYNSARVWYLTGDERYARQGHDILLAWARNHVRWSGAESYLSMGDFAYRLYTGAEILRGTWPGWTEEDTATVKKYFLENYWWAAEVPRPLRSANQGILQLVTGVGVAVFCDDLPRFKQCVEAFRNDVTGGLADSLPIGEVGDSGRDQGHTYGELVHLALIAETFWIQGVDVFSDLDHRLLACGEFYSRYNLGVPTPFMQFGSEYDVYPGHGGQPRSSEKCPDMLNILHNAYVNRLGIPAPYIEAYRQTRRENGESIMFRRDKDKSKARRLKPLKRPATVPVGKFQSTKVGEESSGTATLSHGVWTVTGKGRHITSAHEDAYVFHHLPIEGDGAIVVKVESLESPDRHPIAGLAWCDVPGKHPRIMSIHMDRHDNDRGERSWKTSLGIRGGTASSHRRWGQVHRRWDETTVTMPYWLKMERIGNRLTAYHSTDGASWSPMQNCDFDNFPETSHAGFFVAGGDSVTATFSHVTITGGDGKASAIPAEKSAIVLASPSERSVHVRWLAAYGAVSYRIERAVGKGGFEALSETNGCEFLDRKVRPGREYRYRIVPVGADGKDGEPSDELTVKAENVRIET